MADIIDAKKVLIDEIKKLEYKFNLSKTVTADYFEPGMMENLEHYRGLFDADSGKIIIKTEVKGLRYENRTFNLEKVNIDDSVSIIREKDNLYNPCNFTVKSNNRESLGNLPAELCNALAPLYDNGYLIIEKATVSYMEKIRDRSRYARQGVLFLEIQLILRGI